jgi:His-Xaa-Ser system protein HxsD
MGQSGVATNDLSDGTQVVTFDSTIYRPNAIKKAAYKFGGLFYVLITQLDRATEVRLKPKESCTSPDALVGEFCNEVLDQELRETVAEETAGIRDLLLAQAFSKTTLIDPELETGEYDSEHCAEASAGQ